MKIEIENCFLKSIEVELSIINHTLSGFGFGLSIHVLTMLLGGYLVGLAIFFVGIQQAIGFIGVVPSLFASFLGVKVVKTFT
ncbi:MAG: hypothetical protein MUF42_13655 [Cytophagaceae bacterium]|nr:hypothetical protein [Cytophagaceae bacterium]